MILPYGFIRYRECNGDPRITVNLSEIIHIATDFYAVCIRSYFDPDRRFLSSENSLGLIVMPACCFGAQAHIENKIKTADKTHIIFFI